MNQERPYLVLGLDPGISSCGFCLLDLTNHEILEMGSHLFSAPQNNKNVSLAAERRNARSSRRNNQRTKDRLTHCLRLFEEEGLVPEGADKAWLQSKKGDWPVLKLRAHGLSHLLSDRHFAQVLYSLAGNRGYIPHGEGRGSDEDPDTGAVLSAVKVNSDRLASSKYRTVGEMLNKEEGKCHNKRGAYDLCVPNSLVQDEVHKLFSAQRKLGNERATEAFEAAFIKCLTWEKDSKQKDLKTYDEEVGTCVYFKDLKLKRAPLACPTSELCRAYEKLKHLKYVYPDGTERSLTHEQIEIFLKEIFSCKPLKTKGEPKEVTYTKIKNALKLSGTVYFKGVDAKKESNAVFAPKAWRCLRRAQLPDGLLDKIWNEREVGDAICEALTFASSADSLKQRLDQKLEPGALSAEELEAVMGLPYNSKVFKGYGTRSLKALGMLVDAFDDEGVHTLYDAEVASGLYGYRTNNKRERDERLPAYSAYDPTCKNPVVLRAMGRMRRIVNSIIKIYGVPDEIHVELGRELKLSKKENQEYENNRDKNEKRNREYKEFAAKTMGRAPEEVSRKVVEKLILLDEQGSKDAYFTNVGIDRERLILDENYCDIDHVLPFSRTGNDNLANKVLVLSKHNRDKGNRTPYEWMISGETSAPDWEDFKAHVLNGSTTAAKRKNLLNENLDADFDEGFIKRNLNDTKYMSVAVKQYLDDCLRFPGEDGKRHVFVVTGRATSLLRRYWGLNFGRGNTKDRGDDRHHAVDAAVIAACSQGAVKKIADARKLGMEEFHRLCKANIPGSQPWPGFAAAVRARRETVIPTRMADHGITGELFGESTYRLEGFTDTGKAKVSKRDGDDNRMSDVLGNYLIQPDGGVKRLSGIAYIRLWHDSSAGKKGKWYVEPVYRSEVRIADLTDYVPRFAKQKVARTKWEPVPASARMEPPVKLFSGDVLIVGDTLARYWSFDIGGGKFEFRKIGNWRVKDQDFPTISKWENGLAVKVLQEDCLGHCYSSIELPKSGTTSTSTK